MQTMQTIEGLVETRQMSTRGDAIFAFLTKGGALEKRFLVALFFRRAARTRASLSLSLSFSLWVFSVPKISQLVSSRRARKY